MANNSTARSSAGVGKTMKQHHSPARLTLASVISLAVIAWLLGGTAPLQAATPAATPGAPTPDECARILDRWAVDGKAAPKSLIDQCKTAAAAGTPIVPPPVEAAALDPCGGAGARNSVLCWGPWAGIAPAAGGPPATVAANELRNPDQRPELADQLTPGVNPEGPDFPLGRCTPGAPCGFATVVTGVTSSDDPERTEFARIELSPDGKSFIIRRLDGTTIGSVPMATVITPRADGYGNLRATGSEGDEQSRLVARVVQAEDGTLLLAADIWGHGSRANGGPVNSGYFAWGTTTSQAGLDALNAGNVSATFSGPMSVNNATNATVTLNFGSDPSWTGNWTNPAYSFSAGGVVSGADFVSVASQFSDNVVKDQSLVQGAIVGEAGNRGVTHLIDVTLTGQGLVRDVGLLREVTPASVEP
jgi:hypothetical protein